MRTYSLIMVFVCAFFFGIASLGTVGDLMAVLAGPEWTLENPEAARYANFTMYRDHFQASVGRGDRMIFGSDPEIRAQWQDYREAIQSRQAESAARELLTSFVMFAVFGGLFFAHFFAYRAFSRARGENKALKAKPAARGARVRRLRPKTAAAKRKRVTAGRRKAA